MPAVAAFDLLPGPGLTPADRPHTWDATDSQVAFTTDTPLPTGWYRIRLRLTPADRHAVRKRGELFADGVRLEAFEWNAALAEDFIVRLPQSAERLTLALHHADGRFRIDRFDVRRVTSARALARAVRLKVRLVTTYNCFWPVVARGGRLLAKGDVREFGRKVLKGLGDSRSMRLEVKRAAEANAAWWRRRALPADEAARLRTEAGAIANPVPVVVVIPADPTRIEHARHAALSVCLQLYPHWQLRVAWPTSEIPRKLIAAVEWEPRAKVVIPPRGEGLGGAVRRAVAESGCPQVVILPADWELSELALLRFVGEAGPNGVIGELPTGDDIARPGLVPADTIRLNPPPSDATVVGITRWAAGLLDGAKQLPQALAVPMNAGTFAAPTVAANGPPLVLCADVRGINGWDYLAFNVLKGLRSLGCDVSRHKQAQVQAELIPPHLRPKLADRSGLPQLVVAPPFLVKRFAPDRRTAVFTMWESDRLPAADVAVLNRTGLVIVPSRWAVECFRASGVTVPIELVPLGYDPSTFHSESPRTNVRGATTFGTAGALSAGGVRKNVARVVDLFRAAFPTDPDVRLRVKITPNCPPFDVPPDSRIDVTRATLPHADLAAWNRSLTAYVNASFAEGFGLHLLEAMACGRPMISTRYSGLAEFFDESVGYVVPHRIVPVKNDVYAGHWADPDDAAIIAAMRQVHANPAEATQFGDRAAARARCFTWRDCGRKLVAALRTHDLLPKEW